MTSLFAHAPAPETDPPESGGPYWVDAVLRAVEKHGLPTVITLAIVGLFIYLTLGDVKAIRSDVAETKNVTAEMKNALKVHNDQMVNDSVSLREFQGVQLRVLQAMCYNGAKSDAARLACAGAK